VTPVGAVLPAVYESKYCVQDAKLGVAEYGTEKPPGRRGEARYASRFDCALNSETYRS